jgi:hypothetical protein
MLEEITNFTIKVKRIKRIRDDERESKAQLKKLKIGDMIRFNPAHNHLLPKGFVWCEGQPFVPTEYPKYSKYVEENDLTDLQLPDGYVTVPNMSENGYCDFIIRVK